MLTGVRRRCGVDCWQEGRIGKIWSLMYASLGPCHPTIECWMVQPMETDGVTPAIAPAPGTRSVSEAFSAPLLLQGPH